MMRVLVIEDDAACRMFLKHVFARAGYAVEEAVDGADGLEKFQNNRFDLVVADVMMPRMNGFELIKRIRGLEGVGCKAPILVQTAHHSEFEEAVFKDLGADALIMKPYDIDRILARARELVGLCGPGTDDPAPAVA